MEPESVTSTSESSGIETRSATGTEATLKPKRRTGLRWDQLRERRVNQEKSADSMTAKLKGDLISLPTRIKYKDTTQLQSILRKFLHECDSSRPNQDSYSQIEELIDGIASWKPLHGLFSISNREFDHDTKLCLHSNEAMLQRTVMTTLIDRWQLSNIFTFNCEGQWSLPRNPLPTTGPSSAISSPKPDLAIFFKFESLTNDKYVAIPKPIDDCLRPDGGQWRCFPFLFIEAKRAEHDLNPAVMANAYNASQALYNMHVWMTLAGDAEAFFSKVRVFTIVLNASELALRCYRAEIDIKSMISFQYDEIISLKSYTRDEACKLIKNILTIYGENELHVILKDCFRKIVDSYTTGRLKLPETLPVKRKPSNTEDSSDKRSRRSHNPSNVNTSDSFGASNLSVAP